MTRRARLVVGVVLTSALVAIVVEGLASYVLVIRDLLRSTQAPAALAERRHTKYDPDLGWVNEANVYIPDMYGPRVSLRTNGHGFRNSRDFTSGVPPGRIRVICSGDSFTLGYGVDNDETWCQLLTKLDARLETVNMGQGGYGVDQAYLWFKRDASKLEHQIHLLAFITEDFYRMQSDDFAGYPKPVIGADNGRLVVKNVPVPRRTDRRTWFRLHVETLNGLRTIDLLGRIMVRTGLRARHQSPTSTQNDRETRDVLKQMFGELKHLNEQRASKLVLVYLPTKAEIEGNLPEVWHLFIEQESRVQEIPLIDVFGAFQSLPHEELARLFIPEGQIDYIGAAGHFSVKGNEVVAKVIYEQMRSRLLVSSPIH